MRSMLVWTALILICVCPSLTAAAKPPEDCKARIPSLICEVPPPSKEADFYKADRACLPSDTAKYKKRILASYDLFPGFLKVRFCQIDRIYIEREFLGAAWSNPVDEKNPNRFLIGLRKRDLDADLDVAAYRTWFEQQSFGGNSDYTPKAGLPEVLQVSGKRVPAVAFTLLHELGHTFDYEKGLSRRRAASFPKDEFPGRKGICLNRCNGRFLDPKTAGTFYGELFKRGFLSQLSAVSAEEDFAESFAFHAAYTYLGLDFEVQAGDRRFKLSELLKH